MGRRVKIVKGLFIYLTPFLYITNLARLLRAGERTKRSRKKIAQKMRAKKARDFSRASLQPTNGMPFGMPVN